MTRFTILCQFNGGCMGCCGHDFGTKEQIKEAIKINTEELDKINPKSKAQFMKFRDRNHPMDLRYGVCRNLIIRGEIMFCPLHPSLHGTDLRKGHCDINYLCLTGKEFETWKKEKKDAFLRFVTEKKMDNIDYSILMENGELLIEFKKTYQD